MNLILLGAPGSGKGTQAELIKKDFKLTHISTGDIFRANIKKNTPLGIKAKEYINEGMLVPDDLVIQLVADRLKQKDCLNGFILDGFPRTEFQADKLGEITKINAVINLDIDLKLLLERLSGRRVCNKCGSTNHINCIKTYLACSCGGSFIQREDDKEETVNDRFRVYEKQTKPLINYYKNKGNLINIEADKLVSEVYKDIKKALESL